MSVEGVVSGGYKTVGQIVATNDVRFRPRQSALAIAVELLSSHLSGAPVVDEKGKCIGFVSEFDVFKAIEAGKDLSKVSAQEIMNTTPIAVHESTPISNAVKLMEEKHLLNLPVERNGTVAYSVTRHDLLRAMIGLGLDIEA